MLSVATKMTVCATAATPSTARDIPTARRPSRERLIVGSIRPWLWPRPRASFSLTRRGSRLGRRNDGPRPIRGLVRARHLGLEHDLKVAKRLLQVGVELLLIRNLRSHRFRG